MITFLERKDVEEATQAAVENILSAVAPFYKKSPRPDDTSNLIAGAYMAARDIFLMHLHHHGLIGREVYNSLRDLRPPEA